MRIKFPKGRHRKPSTLADVWQQNINAARSNVKGEADTPFVDLWNDIAAQELQWIGMTYEAGIPGGNLN